MRRDALAIFEQSEDGVFHVHIDPLMDSVILQRADHLQPGAIADVRQARILMTAEISLQNTAILRSIENRAPRFQFAHAIGRFLGVQFGHAPLLTYWPPRMVSAKCTFQLSRSSTLASAAAIPPSAMTVCALPSKRLTNHADRNAGRRRFDRRAQTSAASAITETIVRWNQFRISGHASRASRQAKEADSSKRAAAHRYAFTKWRFNDRLRNDSEIVPNAYRTKAHVKIREADPEQTHPCPEHVAAVETTDAAIGLETGRRPGKLIEKSADQMAQRMTTECVAAKQNDVHRQHDRAHADAKGTFAGCRIDKPKRLPNVVARIRMKISAR